MTEPEKLIVTKLPHHNQQKLCLTRPPYRQGKRLTAVKVYTVNNESQHLMVCGVPKLQLTEEVKKLVFPYGETKKIELVPEYPSEEFTDSYHVQYTRIQSARIAKRFIDGKNFYGGCLHVFYAPELESITETRAKLAQRRRDVTVRIRRNLQDFKNPNLNKFTPEPQYHRRKKTPALPLTEERLAQKFPGETINSIYNGIPRNIDPRPVSEPSLPSCSHSIQNREHKDIQSPYHPAESILQAGRSLNTQATEHVSFNQGQKRNYKGRSMDSVPRSKIVRPRIVDTSTIVKWNSSDKNIFSKAKKTDKNITIKLLPRNNEEKKKIVIKNPSVTQLVQSSTNLQDSIKTVKSQIRAAMQT